MQPPFNFQSSADYYRHLILVPRANCNLLVGNGIWVFQEKKFISVRSGEKGIHKLNQLLPSTDNSWY